MTAFRPRFADFVLKMPRGAQVVYPKDLGPIMMYADIFPGSRVLEAGTGSGALTIALCRSTGPDGRVVSYDLRADHRDQAIENVEAFFGKFPDQLELRDGDIEDVSGTDDRFDRCVLDLPEPWRPLGALHQVMEPGGVLCAYMPTTVQVQELVLALPRQRIPARRDVRDAPPLVARDRAERASGSSDGRDTRGSSRSLAMSAATGSVGPRTTRGQRYPFKASSFRAEMPY